MFSDEYDSKLIQSSYITKHDGISVLNLSDKKKIQTDGLDGGTDGQTDKNKLVTVGG